MNVKTKEGLAQSGNEQLVIIRGNQPFTTSRTVAQVFEKRHDNVLRDIQDLAEGSLSSKDVLNFEEIFLGKDPSEFLLRNFLRVTFKDSYGREQPEYLLTKDGFTLVVMGYTGAKAVAFKIAYISKFNEMEASLRQREEKQLITMKDFVRFGGDGFDTLMKGLPVYEDKHGRMVYPYMMVLEKMGFSLKSGSVWRRQSRYPLAFSSVDGINCITSELAEHLYLGKLNAHNSKVMQQVQLSFDFKNEGGSHDSH